MVSFPDKIGIFP